MNVSGDVLFIVSSLNQYLDVIKLQIERYNTSSQTQDGNIDSPLMAYIDVMKLLVLRPTQNSYNLARTKYFKFGILSIFLCVVILISIWWQPNLIEGCIHGRVDEIDKFKMDVNFTDNDEIGSMLKDKVAILSDDTEDKYTLSGESARSLTESVERDTEDTLREIDDKFSMTEEKLKDGVEMSEVSEEMQKDTVAMLNVIEDKQTAVEHSFTKCQDSTRGDENLLDQLDHKDKNINEVSVCVCDSR
eukprot:GHVR01100802.1.p1 GENE.GHVR01100802.1~~GHVR01100802.1.p1  ORF type:complete len:246 (+),score=31.17 GHVR01100802.1:119-856(+)